MNETVQLLQDVVRNARTGQDAVEHLMQKTEEGRMREELIREKEEVLFAELWESMKSSPRPVRKAIIAKVLEKLPPFLRNQQEIEEYFRVNLFGCRDKAERCAVMAILIEMEEKENQGGVEA